MTHFTYNGRTIVTDFDMKPIPTRRFDWTATFDGYDGSDDSGEPIGRGATEKEAVGELIEKVEESIIPPVTIPRYEMEMLTFPNAANYVFAFIAYLTLAILLGYACYESGQENERDEIQQQKEHGL